MGDYYENQIAISVTLDDGESTLPPFMAFDVQSRTLSMSPNAADIGSYSLHINYDCLKDPDPDSTPSTHEEFSLFKVKIIEQPVEAIEVPPEYIISTEDVATELNSTAANVTNTTTILVNSTASSTSAGFMYSGRLYRFPEDLEKESTVISKEDGPIPKIESISPNGIVQITFDRVIN